MRHTYPTVFSCQDSPQPSEEQQPLSPQTPSYKEPPMLMEQKPLVGTGMAPPQGFPMDYSQIKVEIPMRPITQIPMFTPESSSPESSASLHTSMFPQPSFPLEVLEDILPARDILPELKDEIEEILRQVEQSPPPSVPPNVNLGHRHSMPSAFDSAELYKYLGPALFDGGNSNLAPVQNNQAVRMPIQQAPTMSFPPNYTPSNFVFHNHQHHHQHHHPHPYNFDYYNRKRSWAV